MAIDPVQTRFVQALVAVGAIDPVNLRAGLLLDARITAINPDDTLRLATRFGMIDMEASTLNAALAGAQNQAPTVAKGQTPVASSLIGTMLKLEVVAADAVEGRIGVKLHSVDGMRLASQTKPQDPLQETAPSPSRVVAEEVAKAAARQDGLAPLFATMARLTRAGTAVPDPVARALAAVAGLAIDAGGTVKAADIRNAIASSGLFLEAKLARRAAGVIDPATGAPVIAADPDLAQHDLKAGLYALKAAVDAWIGPTEAEAGQTTAPGATPASEGEATVSLAAAARGRVDAAVAAPLEAPGTSGPAQAGPTTAPGLAAAARATATIDADALFAVFRPPPTVTAQPAPSATPMALATGPLANRPDLAMLAALGEVLPAAPRTTPRNNRAAPPADANLDASDDRATAGLLRGEVLRPAPPRRGLTPRGQAAIALPKVETASPQQLAADLADRIDNALARVTLGQYASLPDTGQPANAQQTAQTQAPHAWIFEIPLTIAGQTSIAQFEIDHDGQGASAEPGGGRTWRAHFSLDLTPVGPVHARLVLAGSQLSVGLWSERPDAAAALGADVAWLRRALDEAGLPVDEIHLATGQPPTGQPARAGGFIDRRA